MTTLGVAIGNTHVQWGCWRQGLWCRLGTALQRQWSSFLDDVAQGISQVLVASVVPALTDTICQCLRQTYPRLRIKVCQLGDLPLRGCYATMGVDRGLCAAGAMRYYGCPVLVIDAGTAISLTAIAEEGTFWGGPIMPGLWMQLRSLAEGTAVLPAVALPATNPVEFWAKDTPNSIYSGVIHGAIAALEKYIALWRRDFPQGAVVITGGDGSLLQAYLGAPCDPDLIFKGLEVLV